MIFYCLWLSHSQDDLLGSLLEQDSIGLDQLPPPLSSPPLPFSPLHSVHTTQAAASLATSMDPMAPSPSPTNDGCVSDGSSLNRAHSPYSYASCSPGNMLGSSPTSIGPGDLMMTSSVGVPSDELAALLGSLTSSTGSPSEVKIDVGQ